MDAVETGILWVVLCMAVFGLMGYILLLTWVAPQLVHDQQKLLRQQTEITQLQHRK
jgi:hypothetical protein